MGAGNEELWTRKMGLDSYGAESQKAEGLSEETASKKRSGVVKVGKN